MTNTVINQKKRDSGFLLFLPIFVLLLLPGAVLADIPFQTMPAIFEKDSRIEDIAASSDNMLFAVDSSKKQILIYDGNDLLDSTIAVELPTTVAVDGPVLYAGSNKDLSVKILNLMTGEIIGVLGRGKDEFKLPRNIAVNPTNHEVYVVDQLDHSIKIYSPDGSFLSSIYDYPNLPQDVTIIGQEIFVLDQPMLKDKNGFQVRGARVAVYDMAGNQVRTFGSFGTERGQLLRPKSITSDQNDLIYITDSFHGAVLCFDKAGNFLQTIIDKADPMVAPVGIAIDDTGRMLVSSPMASKLNVYKLNTAKLGGFTPYSLYFPRVDDSENQTFYNIISVQNAADVEHTVTVKAYDGLDGSLTATYKKVIPAKGVIRIRPAGGGTEWQTLGNSITNLPEFFGSIIIDSSQPVLATNLFMASSGAFTLFESATPEQAMLFPMVLDNQDEWESWLTIQNIYDTEQSITVNVYDTAGFLAGSDTITIPAHGLYHNRPSQILDPAWISTHSQGINQIDGSIVVSCNNSPLVGILAYQHGTTLDSLSIYESIKPAKELFIPIIRDMPTIFPEASGSFSDLYLTSTAAQTVNYAMFHYDGTPAENGAGRLVFNQANETLIISPAGLLGLPEGSGQSFEGVMRISAVQPIYGLNQVEHVGTSTIPGATSLAFEFPGTPEKELFFPEVYDGALGWSSMISIQNTVGYDHRIDVVFIRADGKTFIDQYTVPANGAYLLHPGSTPAGGQAGIDNFFQGAVHITTNEPVAAVLQYAHHPDEAYPQLFDNLEIYNALTTPSPR